MTANNTLITELRNPETYFIDQMTTLEMLRVMNSEDSKVAGTVQSELSNIAAAVDMISVRMKQGGRLFYVGAGTSGRLGVLDASECPPTFNASPDQVIGIIAGGYDALVRSIEGAEDDELAGYKILDGYQISSLDSVVGIAASGGTPFVIGALKKAKQTGCLTISITCNQYSMVEEHAAVKICLLVGPEVITGSTRLKSGTAQKMVLNMISTGVMVRLGKTYGNLMVDVRATNKKLRTRARKIVAQACEISEDLASDILEKCSGEVKTAIVSYLLQINAETARKRLEMKGGVVREALKE